MMSELLVFSNMLGVIQGWDEEIRKMLHWPCERDPPPKRTTLRYSMQIRQLNGSIMVALTD
jgi:hypothetical protein